MTVVRRRRRLRANAIDRIIAELSRDWKPTPIPAPKPVKVSK